jgi:hypothetical protein
MKYRLMLVLAVVCVISCVFSNAQESSPPAEEHTSFSPDKKWEYLGRDEPKIVATDTKQVMLQLSDQGPGDVVWAPDSKRFAYNWGHGRTRQTAFYQLSDDQWVALDFPADNDDTFEKQANDIVAGQLKKEGLSEKKLERQGKFLRLIWDNMKVDRWLDSNTAIVHSSLQQVAARRDAPGGIMATARIFFIH